MTTNYHTPITTGAPADAATFNAPMGQLDQAIGATNADFDALELRMSKVKNGHIIQNNGVALTQRSVLNFVGGLVAEDITSPASTRISFQAGWITFPGVTWDVDSDLDPWTLVCSDSDLADPEEGDYTSILGPGTKIKFTQGSTVKYGVVKASEFTLLRTYLTLFENTDYIPTYGTAITSPYYAYDASLPDWPDWFNYDAVVDGSSGSAGTFAETGKIARFCVRGRTLTLRFQDFITNVGSWGGYVQVALPIMPIAIDGTSDFMLPCDLRSASSGILFSSQCALQAENITAFFRSSDNYPNNLEWSEMSSAIIFMNIEIEF